MRKDRIIVRLFVLAILLFGAVIFVLPFLDMVFTSVKLDDEIASEKYHLLPRTPHAQWQSPYVDQDFDNHVTRPADMPATMWQEFEPRFTETVRAGITKWWDSQAFIAKYYGGVDRAAAIETLTQTVGHHILARLSDKARQAGIPAMLANAAELCNHETIFPEFKMYVPRFALGEVRVRLSDFSRRNVGGPVNWQVDAEPTGVATLAVSEVPLDDSAQANIHFASTSDVAHFSMISTPPGMPMAGDRDVPAATSPAAATRTAAALGNPATVEPLGHPERETAEKIDRVYVGYLPDRSWCKIDVFVTRNNIRYRMKEPLYSDDVRWNELELRWPEGEQDAFAGRAYRLLERIETPPPPDGASRRVPRIPFAVEFVVTPTSAPGAIYAKTTRNYFIAFQQVPIGRYIMTSISLAILNIILVVFASSFVAYAFARVDFPGRNFLFGVLLATMMIPGQVTMIPTFLIYKNLGWYNTLLPLWMPSAFGTAFFIFMARQFLKSIPKELEEAARIDGCGFFRIYWHIMLPLIRPTLAAIAMFAFQGAWNNFMGPLLYLNDERKFNLAFGLFKFQTIASDKHTLMMAGAFVMTLPLIATFFLFQRYFVQGVALSGLGGK